MKVKRLCELFVIGSITVTVLCLMQPIDALKEQHYYKNYVCIDCGKPLTRDDDSRTIMISDSIYRDLGLPFNGRVIIPEKINYEGIDYTVVGLCNGLFNEMNEIQSVEVPDTVTYFGDYLFNGCTDLVAVNIPQNLVYIGRAAFQCCYSLTSVNLPDSVEYIGDFAFNHCSAVDCELFKLPASLISIGKYHHYPAHAFYDFGTDSFTEFIIDESSQHYKTIDGILYTKDGRTLISIPRGKEFSNGVYEIPNSVVNLGELSFSRNDNIKEILLPDNLVVDPLQNNYEKASYINSGNDLSVACYLYSDVEKYLVRDTNNRYRSVDGILYTKDLTHLVAIPNNYTGDVVIPDGVLYWDDEAIWTEVDAGLDKILNHITSIHIPRSMISIGDAQIDEINSIVDYYGTTIMVDSNSQYFSTKEDGYFSHLYKF